MLKSKRTLPSYPDGVLEVCKAKDRKSDFGARLNVEKKSDTEFICSLFFCSQTIREQDYDFAERSSINISLKVKTPRFDLVKSDCLVLIGTKLYEITHIDTASTEMYLYLEEVRDIDVTQ